MEATALILAVGLAVTEIAVRRRLQHAAAARLAGYLDGIRPASGNQGDLSRPSRQPGAAVA